MHPFIMRILPYCFSVFLLINILSCSHFNKKAKGNAVYGGVLKVSESDSYITLYPSGICEDIGGHIANQIYEGLVRFNMKDLSILPAIAERWEIDANATTYTFYLKKGIYFHDDDCFPGGTGRELKAKDVKYSFELLCTDIPENINYTAILKDKVAGANDFFANSKGNPKGSLNGIEVMDDYTVKIRLNHPDISFLYRLALPGASIIPKEAVTKYGLDSKIGTGAFTFQQYSNGNIVLKNNPHYYRKDSSGNRLPFLDSVQITLLNKQEALEKFQKDELSLIIGLPSEFVTNLVTKQIEDFKNKPPKYLLERIPEMSNQYYEFNLTKIPFNNRKVRQAFSYAIDRNKIIEETLNGEAWGAAIYGFIPPTFQGYDITKIKGYDFNPEQARALLAEAGYPDGKGFPKSKIILNSGGTKHSLVVIEIQKQLKNVLNIDVDFDVVSYKQKMDDAKFGRSEIFRSSWVADYPSPENFLYVMFGGTLPTDLSQESFPNTCRYKNARFDSLYLAGTKAKTKTEAYHFFMQADQQLMNDAPIVMLWYTEDYRLIKSSVHNLFANPIRFRDYSEVYLKNPEIQNAEVEN